MTGATQRQPAVVGRAPSARRLRRPQRCAAVASPSHPPQEQLEVLTPCQKSSAGPGARGISQRTHRVTSTVFVSSDTPWCLPEGRRVKLADMLG